MSMLMMRTSKLDGLLSGISFRAQVAKATQVYKDDILSEYAPAVVEKISGDLSHYYSVGWSDQFQEIKNLVDQLIIKGFEDAVVIPYFNGLRIDRRQAEALAPRHPQLRDYLRSLR